MKKTIANTLSITSFLGVYSFLESSSLEEKLGLVYGDAGLGKTTAAKRVAKSTEAVYIRCLPSWTSPQFVSRLLCETVGDLRYRSYGQAMDALISYFTEQERALILDEVEYLVKRRDVLESVRSIHDQTEIPIILVGMTGVYESLRSFKLFVDRIQYFCEVRPCSLQDARQIADTRCEVTIEDDLLAHLHQQQKGNLRQLCRSLAHIESEALANGWETVSLERWRSESLGILPAGAIAPTRSRRTAA